jgi:GH35 family endo-1,4-beta-xylanase
MSPPRLRPTRSSLLLLAAFCLVASRSGAQGANLLTNPGFEDGTAGWTPFGPCQVATSAAEAHGGALAGLATGRAEPWMGPARDLRGVLAAGASYRIAAWVRLAAAGAEPVRLTLKQADDAGARYWSIDAWTARGDRWIELSGAFTLRASGTPTELTLYVEGPAAGVDLLVDDASLVALDDWRPAADERIERLRKRDVRVQALDRDGRPVAGASVVARQVRHAFGFGAAMTRDVLTDGAYADFFRTHFEWAVFENESKWYHEEPARGAVSHADADAMLAFCRDSALMVRGHSLFWDQEEWVQPWVRELPDDELRAAVDARLQDAVAHFKGSFAHWDVNNEMLHGGYFERRLGPDVGPWMFREASRLDPSARLFVNDFNVVSYTDTHAYVDSIRGLLAGGAPVQGVGAQCHMQGRVDGQVVLDRLDKLAEAGLPIWATEFDTVDADAGVRADNLEAFYRAAFSHPGVDGILMWGFWAGRHWRGPDAAIVDLDWTVNEAGRRYEQLLAEWTTLATGTTDDAGAFSYRGFHGDYEVTITPRGGEPVVRIVTLDPADDPAVLVVRVEPPAPWLLRDDSVTSLHPPTPPLAAILGGAGLDLVGPDGVPDEGEGLRLEQPGSADDDDAYVRAVASGALDPDPTCAADPSRPLVFYQLSRGDLVLRVNKDPSGALRVAY